MFFLRFRVLFGLSIVASFISIVGYSIWGIKYLVDHPEVRARIAYDYEYVSDWVEKYENAGLNEGCERRQVPLGYRCFFNETQVEMAKNPISFPAWVALWAKGSLVVANGDPEHAKQVSYVGGAPDERKKMDQFKHWTGFVINRLISGQQSVVTIDGVAKVIEKRAPAQAAKKAPSMGQIPTSLKDIDLDQIRDAIKRRNDSMAEMERFLNEK